MENFKIKTNSAEINSLLIYLLKYYKQNSYLNILMLACLMITRTLIIRLENVSRSKREKKHFYLTFQSLEIIILQEVFLHSPVPNELLPFENEAKKYYYKFLEYQINLKNRTNEDNRNSSRHLSGMW